MKIHDATAGVLLAVFAVALFLYAGSFPSMEQQIGPGLFPQLLAVGCMICALLLVRKGLRQPRSGGWLRLPAWGSDRRATFSFLLVPLSLVFYIYASETLGFLPTAAVLLLTLFLTFRARLAAALPIAIGSALGMHFIFYQLLKVPLPWGLLQPIAW